MSDINEEPSMDDASSTMSNPWSIIDSEMEAPSSDGALPAPPPPPAYDRDDDHSSMSSCDTSKKMVGPERAIRPLKYDLPAAGVRRVATYHGHQTPRKHHRDLHKDSSNNNVIDPRVSANRPHPSLEYPPLYFVIKRMPWIFESIKVAYVMRWRLSYPLQKKVPLSHQLRKLRIHLTWGELFLLVPFFLAMVLCVSFTVIRPSVSLTGRVARTALIASLVLAQRNAIVTMILGMPIDRAVFYHKLSGRVAYAAGVMHTCAYFLDPKFVAISTSSSTMNMWSVLNTCSNSTVTLSGSIMLVLMTAIVATSLPPVRRLLFEAFYYIHVTCVIGMVAGAFFHTGILVPVLTVATWGVDVFMRKVYMAQYRYPRTASIRCIGDTVIEVKFPKLRGFDYNPGQYIYIAFPEISWLEWHPFSISSSPKQSFVTLHIRKVGNWTSALHELARKQSEASILIEGPYGSLGVDMMQDRYKVIMLVSGGIGITPMQSICDQLLYEQAKGRRMLQKIRFIWTERDPIVMSEARFVHRASSMLMNGDAADHEDGAGSASTVPPVRHVTVDEESDYWPKSMASRLLAAIPPGTETDEELNDMYAEIELSLDEDEERMLMAARGKRSDDNDTHPDNNTSTASGRQSYVGSEETSLADPEGVWHPTTPTKQASALSLPIEKVLDLQVHLTSKTTPFRIPYAQMGRPNIKDIFMEMKREAVSVGERRVAVCVCAPQKLTYLCQKACIVYSDTDVRFDFHSEPTA